jgi:hypothetical protein
MAIPVSAEIRSANANTRRLSSKPNMSRPVWLLMKSGSNDAARRRRASNSSRWRGKSGVMVCQCWVLGDDRQTRVLGAGQHLVGRGITISQTSLDPVVAGVPDFADEFRG